jgi:hypothetical protein
MMQAAAPVSETILKGTYGDIMSMRSQEPPEL